MNDNILLFFIVIAIVVIIIYKRKTNQEKIDKKPKFDNTKNIDTKQFNGCVVLFLDLYNELTERVKNSINSDNRFSLDEKVLLIKETEKNDLESIKQSLRHFHLQGKFNDVIDDYLIGDSDIDTIIYRIIEISKTSSKIPNHILIDLDSKEIFIQSFLQNEIETRIKTELFLLNSVKDVELILLDLIKISRVKLETMALSKKM